MSASTNAVNDALCLISASLPCTNTPTGTTGTNMRPNAFPTLLLSLLRGGAAQFDKNCAGLERVYLKENFARRARHSGLVNFGNGCNRWCSLPGHNHVPGREVLGKS